MLKTWPLPVCVCVCVCVLVGGQDVITIQTSTMTPPSATVSCVSTARGVGGWGSGYSHNACWYMRAHNNNGNAHRRKIKMSQNRENTLKK